MKKEKQNIKETKENEWWKVGEGEVTRAAQSFLRGVNLWASQ